MFADMKVIHHSTREGMHAHFRLLDIFSNDRELSTAYAGASDCDVSLRMDDDADPFTPPEPKTPEVIEANFKAMARAYAASSPPLIHWVKSGNPLPECYR